jgi:hypothetical protein
VAPPAPPPLLVAVLSPPLPPVPEDPLARAGELLVPPAPPIRLPPAELPARLPPLPCGSPVLLQATAQSKSEPSGPTTRLSPPAKCLEGALTIVQIRDLIVHTLRANPFLSEKCDGVRDKAQKHFITSADRALGEFGSAFVSCSVDFRKLSSRSARLPDGTTLHREGSLADVKWLTFTWSVHLEP